MKLTLIFTMNRILPIVVLGASLLASAATARADVAADIAALKKLEITALCPLFIETALAKNGAPLAAIVSAEGEPWAGAAARLQAGIAERTGVTLPVVAAEKVTEADWASRNLIVLGNLLASPVYARLYNNYFVCADAAYTGTGGYELRSVHNPWGTGRNAIVLGAQDAKGAEAAVAKFIGLVDAHGKKGGLVLPRLLELHLTKEGRRAPLEEVLTRNAVASLKKALDETAAKPGQDSSVVSSSLLYAMRYHRTGDAGWLELFRHGLRLHLHYYATDDYINNDGPRRYDRDFRDSYAYRMIVAWDLLEEDPVWTDAERLEMTNHILRLNFECNLKNNWDSEKAVQRWLTFDGIMHNHQTWPGLANLFGGWYFTRHYRLPLAETWLKMATTMFHSASRSAKPQEDAAGYEWIPRRHLLTYALASGDRTYIEEGHAAETGCALLMSIDTLGHQPAWGDSENLTATSQMAELLSVLEYVLHDGRYRWMAEKLGLDARGEANDPHWTNVEPRQPDDLTGISVSYLPKPHYATLGRDREEAAPFRAANLPFEQTFDKLVLRGGLGAGDDYLMLDGYAGGDHGHLDGNAIIDFTSHGAHWLVDGEYIRRTPKYHCAVTVQRDGVTRAMPTNAQLDAAAWFGEGALTRTTVPGCNGVSWSRSIVNVSGLYTVVSDEVTAEVAGDYALRCCWRVLGQAELKGGTLELRQREKGFALKNVSGQRQELVFIKNSGELLFNRTSGAPIHQLYQFENRHLSAGEKVRFINVFAAEDDGVPVMDAQPDGESRVRVTIGGRTELCGTGGLDGPVKTDAELFRLTSNEAWLVQATKFETNGQSLLQAPQRVSARLDARGLALGKSQPVPAAGLMAAETIGEPAPLAHAPDCGGAVHAATSAKPTHTESAAANQVPARQDAVRWRFDKFAQSSGLLEVRRIEASPPPTNPKQPLEFLIDGRFTGSTDSCALATGKAVSITLDLGSEQRISEVRVHAWEAYDQWKTKNLRVTLSNDRFEHDVRPAGALPVTHVGEGKGNIDTLHALALSGQSARYVRISAEPLTAKAQAYFSEIEVLGSSMTQTPRLTALASADLDGDGKPDVVVGAANGDLVAMDADGSELWRRNVGAAILSLAAGPLSPDAPPVVVCGADDVVLRVFSREGRPLASVTPPEFRYVQSRVRNITFHDLDGDGVAEIIIGCESWQYMAYKLAVEGASTALKLDWKSIFYAHKATVTHIADLDGDGQPEIVAGNNYYSLQILDRRGKVIGSNGGVGPEQTAVTSVALPESKQRAAVLGFDDGDVMAFTATGKRLWTRNAGDRVTTLRTDDINGKPQIVAASEGSLVAAFDVGGNLLWKCNVGAPVKRLVRVGEAYLAATARGVVRLSLDGVLGGTLATSAPVFDLCLSGNQVLALQTDGAVVSLRMD